MATGNNEMSDAPGNFNKSRRNTVRMAKYIGDKEFTCPGGWGLMIKKGNIPFPPISTDTTKIGEESKESRELEK